jgi:glutathione S-transferase
MAESMHPDTRRRPRGKRKALAREAASPHPASPDLELYQRESDAESRRVRQALSARGLDFLAHSVESDPLKHQELVRAAGRDQVPYLVDHRAGVKLAGADAILAYLERDGAAPWPVHQFVEFTRREVLKRLPRPVRRRVRRRLERWERASARAARITRDVRGTLLGAVRLIRRR